MSNISIVAISIGLPVVVNNPVPASQVGFQPVLPLSSYGKVLDFMIKSTRSPKNTRYKGNQHTVKMPRKCIAMLTISIVQLIVNQRQRKREIAATFVFYTGH